MTATSHRAGSTAAAADLGSVLALLREHAVALGGCGPQPPSRVRLEAAGVVVELGWYAVPGETGTAGGPPVHAVPGPAVLEQRGPGLVGSAATHAGAAVDGAQHAEASHNGAGTAVAGHRITAPTVGVFYRSPEPGAAPFVAEGDTVLPGQQVAIVEAMKLMIPVAAEQAGRVAAVLCADAEAVEFGQPLFVLDAP